MLLLSHRTPPWERGLTPFGKTRGGYWGRAWSSPCEACPAERKHNFSQDKIDAVFPKRSKFERRLMHPFSPVFGRLKHKILRKPESSAKLGKKAIFFNIFRP